MCVVKLTKVFSYLQVFFFYLQAFLFLVVLEHLQRVHCQIDESVFLFAGVFFYL